MENKKIIGSLGEKLAVKYLENKGYKIIDVNFYCKYGEIDIVAKFERMVVFIEVKTRTSLKHGFPIDGVNHKKIIHIRNSARYYLYKNKIFNFDIRFDVIEVYLKKSKYVINHIKDIIQ